MATLRDSSVSGKQIAKLVEFGRGGDVVELARGSRCSGYGTPENPHAADPKSYIFPDGTPAIDKRPAIDTEAGYRWVFRGPMVDVDLEPGAVDAIGDISDNIMVRAMMNDPGNEFGTLAAMQIAHTATKREPGPLDFVDIATYIEGWRAVGARIGHYQDNAIVWDD